MPAAAARAAAAAPPADLRAGAAALARAGMKIVSQTADALHLRHFPWLAGGLIAALGGAGLVDAVFDDGLAAWERLLTVTVSIGALVLAWWMAPVMDVVFDRRSGEARYSERRFTGTVRRHLPLGTVHRVELETDFRDGARPNRLILVTADGRLPLEKGFGPIDRTAVAERLNGWLASAPGR